MAKSEIISKKRKRPLSAANDGHSLTEILTRSYRLINLQRYRSGESMWGRIQQNIKPLSGGRKSSSSMGCDLSSGSIKDLLLRRVFSPFSEDGVIENSLDDIEKLEKSEPGGDCLGKSKEARENGDFRKLYRSNEDTLLSTPPDSEGFCTRQVVEGNGFSDQVLENKPMENLQIHDGCTEKGFYEDRNGTNSSTKSILKPRSRVKLFKTPGSFSYRRLLPYLMDMEKEHSSTPIMSNCQKTERGLEEEQSLDSRSEENVEDNSKTNGSMEGNYNDSCKRLNMVSVESVTIGDLESSMPFVNEKIQKPELQVSCEGQNLNSSKLNSSPTIVDSCFNKEKLTDVICSGQMTKYDNEVANTNGPSHCSAQNRELLGQKLLTVISKSESCDSDNIRQNSDDEQKQSEIKGMPIATTFHSFEAQQLNSANSVLCKMRGQTKCSLQQRGDSDGEVLEQVEKVNTECMSMALPGSDLCSRPETGDRVEGVSPSVDHVIEKSTNEVLHRNNVQDGDKSLGNNFVSNARLQKFSKILNSSRHRRLLPFLKEIAKDYSCNSGNDLSLKVEKSSKEKPISSFVTSGKEICMENLSSKSCSVEHYNIDESLPSVPATTGTRCSPHKQVGDSPMLMDSQQEQESLVMHAALVTIKKLETSPGNSVEPSAMSTSSLTSSRLLPGEQGAKLVTHPSEEACIQSTLKCADSEKETEAYISPVIPVSVVKKGILKRNPRGCRGVCTCLNCSSFRLRAERSFEFSRNQMQDAEEVALDLIKELKWLRNILGKSAFDANDQSSIRINQVKEACNKASVAEEVARTRLREMNDNLNVHCRIPCGQRPSVRFANNVEEHVFTISDSSSK